MARGRMLSKSLSTSERYAMVPEVLPVLFEFAQSLYPLLVAHSDDFGRQQGDLHTIQTLVHPSSDRSRDEFTLALQALHDVGLIVWYEVKGKRYIQISQWDAHQVGLHKRTRSKFPAPPGNSGNPREGTTTPPTVPAQEKRTELNLTELKGTEEEQVQDQVSNASRSEFSTIGQQRSRLKAALHDLIDQQPDVTEGELAEVVKGAIASMRIIDGSPSRITALIDAVRGERARRSA